MDSFKTKLGHGDYRFSVRHSPFDLHVDHPMISSIITHPGGAHKDDFLACSVLLHDNPVSIFRREPTESDLADQSIAVLDVGGEHESVRAEFSITTNFPATMCPPVHYLSFFNIWEFMKMPVSFVHGLEVAEWFDCRGPKDTAEWLRWIVRLGEIKFSP